MCAHYVTAVPKCVADCPEKIEVKNLMPCVHALGTGCALTATTHQRYGGPFWHQIPQVRGYSDQAGILKMSQLQLWPISTKENGNWIRPSIFTLLWHSVYRMCSWLGLLWFTISWCVCVGGGGTWASLDINTCLSPSLAAWMDRVLCRWRISDPLNALITSLPDSGTSLSVTSPHKLDPHTHKKNGMYVDSNKNRSLL